MTIICYRDGVMAADTAAFYCDFIHSNSTKIFKTPNGELIGFAGEASYCNLAAQWFLNGGDKADRPSPPEESVVGLLVKANGEVYGFGNDLNIYPMAGDFFVRGAAAEIAFGAMAAGASAEQAVRIAVQYHQAAAGGVTVLKLNES